ncbi:hypothetical protein EFB08_18250 [Rufibacter latericius]|uniref:Uncharacterized protein n=1 Tax=Rufibacter latericius TaxID=2487040 RepID=A0A3M9MD26_9BACT|nr:hypothetical protein EFB08_18250 [Rufibacter latericius]
MVKDIVIMFYLRYSYIGIEPLHVLSLQAKVLAYRKDAKYARRTEISFLTAGLATWCFLKIPEQENAFLQRR